MITRLLSSRLLLVVFAAFVHSVAALEDGVDLGDPMSLGMLAGTVVMAILLVYIIKHIVQAHAHKRTRVAPVSTGAATRTMATGRDSSSQVDHTVIDSNRERKLPDDSGTGLINPTEVVILDVLGVGQLGRVHKARYRGLPVAMKELQYDLAGRESHDNQTQQHEVETMIMRLCALRHPSLVLVLGVAFPTDDKAWIVTEFMGGGTLYDFLHTRQDTARLSWAQRVGIALNIAQAVAYLHHSDVVHGDLTAVNVLVNFSDTADVTAKVADPGLLGLRSLVCGHEVIIKPVWTAPEVLVDNKQSKAADMYSLGVIIWELFFGKIPYSHLGKAAATRFVQAISKGARPPLPVNCPFEVKELIIGCWHADPSERWGCDKVVSTLPAIATLDVDVKELTHVFVDESKSGVVDRTLIPKQSSGTRTGPGPAGSSAMPRVTSLTSEDRDDFLYDDEDDLGRQPQAVPAQRLKDCLISLSELKLTTVLGVGSYGKVYNARFRGADVAVKMVSSNGPADQQLRSQFLREMYTMCGLSHPNTVLFMGAVVEDDTMAIVMEKCGKGSLFNLLHDVSVAIDYHLIVKLCLDVAEGMNALHLASPPILHRDLKSPNILVDDDWTAKVSDFGLTSTKECVLAAALAMGTPKWQAPEALEAQYTEKSDVFSFGVIVWELFTRKIPFHNMNPHQVAFAVLNDNARPDIPGFVPDRFAALIRDCWERDPTRRPRFTDIIDRLKLIQLQGLPKLHLTLDNAKLYEKRHPVFAFQCRDPVVVTKPWGTGQSKPNDWIIVGPNDDVYTCDASVFERTYEATDVAHHMYRKVAKTLARKMTSDFLIETMEGTEHGAKGGYLAQGIDGEQWPIDEKVFEDMYVVSAEQVLEEHHMAALKEQLSKQLEEEKALHREHARAQHKRLAVDSDDSDVLE